MSKKMMKRSLALGALMAFVITGSAMAAETELESRSSVVAHGTYVVNGDVVISGHNDTMIGGTRVFPEVPSEVTATKISIADGKTLTVETDGTATGETQINGVICNTNITADKDKNTSVILKANSTKEDSAGLGQYSQDSIKANYIEIYSGKYAIYGSQSDDKHVLDANTVKLESKGRTVYTQDSTIEITAGTLDVVSTRESGAVALTANGSGGIDINADDVKLTGDIDLIGNEKSDINFKSQDKESTPGVMQITGNINATTGALIGFVVDGSESFVKGSINTGSNTKADITFSNDGRWNNTGVSNVNTLILDGGIVDNTASSANHIEVGTLSGNGTLLVADATANQMVVTKKDEGAELTVSTNEDIALKDLVNVATYAEGSENDGSAANYVEKTGGDIYSSEKAVIANGKIGEIIKTVAEANINVSDMAALGLMSWRAETNDMNKRMGELRNANGEHGVWVRAVGGEDEYKSVEYDYTQYQLGYDEKLSTDPSWTVGVALSYTDGESKFAKGSGENENKGVAIYGSKLNADGSFIDLIAKYSRMENDFKTIGGMGDADYSTNGYSFSAEYGKRIQQGNGLWIEPQVELTYGRVADVDYVTAKGVKVAQDSMESIVGRVGFSLGKDIKQGNVYARASYLYDFDGETSVSLGGQENLEQDLGGGWWEVGVGANINLSKATYVYADVEKTFGGEVDTNWQWNLGVRYSF